MQLTMSRIASHVRTRGERIGEAFVGRMHYCCSMLVPAKVVCVACSRAVALRQLATKNKTNWEILRWRVLRRWRTPSLALFSAAKRHRKMSILVKTKIFEKEFFIAIYLFIFFFSFVLGKNLVIVSFPCCCTLSKHHRATHFFVVA